MKTIDEARLETDLDYRYEYLAEFIGFGPEDIAAIHSSIGHLAPMFPKMVDATYDKLLAYDATARHFVPRQHNYEGDVPETMADLSQTHEQIKFRKEHLSRYLMRLIGNAYDSKMVKYLDVVGKMHTPGAGNKSIDVPLVQMNALMGVLSDILTEMILQLDLDAKITTQMVRAFNKLMWIQNDLINRHYAAC
ncbi:MAG: hypothetical protein COA78_01125 [Blastopirellula sp.]|nr:MAG: hypothetical protein COA78_01125 [Blastopirellula sp.]